jgi:hypothetical protein
MKFPIGFGKIRKESGEKKWLGSTLTELDSMRHPEHAYRLGLTDPMLWMFSIILIFIDYM